MRTDIFFAAAILGFTNVSALFNKKALMQSKTQTDKVKNIQSRIKAAGELDPQTHWFDAVIDHYDSHGADSATYPMRYLVDDTYFDPVKGPIIFYAGNEGDVWTFFDNSGFMTTTLAETFGALVVFGEHRYFGESMPFGADSFKRENLPYLTVEQAMMDYVDLIKFLKTDLKMEDRAVIVGGGSYGGMLAAWLRMKYPQWFQGALAASAPILFFEGYVDPEAYDRIATTDFAKADPDCPVMIREGFDLLESLRTQPDSYEQIAQIFNLCTVPTGAGEIEYLISTLSSSFGTMAMVDYPYPTDFIEPLPAWPINYACA